MIYEDIDILDISMVLIMFLGLIIEIIHFFILPDIKYIDLIGIAFLGMSLSYLYLSDFFKKILKKKKKK